MNNSSNSKRFEACSRKLHGDCPAAKYENIKDAMGTYEMRVTCNCHCHNQGNFFPVEKKQKDLFAGMNTGLFAGAKR